MISHFILCLAVFQAYAITCQAVFTVGDNLCVQGYIMDKYCIDAVDMIDNGKETLKEPFAHSVHCLVDVSICYNSHFEVLTNPTTDGGLYNRGYRLTETSKQNVMELARSVGSCSTCVNGYDPSKLESGFRAVLNATILEVSTDDGTGPPLIMVHNQAYPNPSDTDPCQTIFALTEGAIMGNNPNVTETISDTTSGSGAIPLCSFSSLLVVLGVLSLW